MNKMSEWEAQAGEMTTILGKLVASLTLAVTKKGMQFNQLAVHGSLLKLTDQLAKVRQELMNLKLPQ